MGVHFCAHGEYPPCELCLPGLRDQWAATQKPWSQICAEISALVRASRPRLLPPETEFRISRFKRPGKVAMRDRAKI